MKRIHAIAAALVLCLVPALSSAGEAPPMTLVPGGTEIPVHVIGDVSSSTAKAGDAFQVQAARDVVVDGLIVIKAGALGSGTIVEVVHAGGGGHSGSMTLDFNWIYAVDGGKIHLARATQKQAEDDRKGAASTATIVGVATLGIGGLFGHNLAHGKEVTIDDKKILTAFVADNVHVAAHEKAQAEDHFDH